MSHLTLDELRALVRGHDPEQRTLLLAHCRNWIAQLRQKENAARAQLEAIEAQLLDQEIQLRVAESLESCLTSRRERARSLSVAERQPIVRLVVKEVQLDGDKVVIKHSIPVPGGRSGPGYRLRPRRLSA